MLVHPSVAFDIFLFIVTIEPKHFPTVSSECLSYMQSIVDAHLHTMCDNNNEVMFFEARNRGKRYDLYLFT